MHSADLSKYSRDGADSHSGARWLAGGPTYPTAFPFIPNEPIPVIVFLKENYGIRIFLI